MITLTALSDLLFDSFEIHRILVVAPLRVARFSWSMEIEKWDHLKMLKYSVVVGTEKERLAALSVKADILKNETGAKAWINMLKDYGAIDHLDRTLVVSIIDRIEIVDAEHIHITTRFDGEILEMERFISAYEAKEAV